MLQPKSQVNMLNTLFKVDMLVGYSPWGCSFFQALLFFYVNTICIPYIPLLFMSFYFSPPNLELLTLLTIIDNLFAARLHSTNLFIAWLDSSFLPCSLNAILSLTSIFKYSISCKTTFISLAHQVVSYSQLLYQNLDLTCPYFWDELPIKSFSCFEIPGSYHNCIYLSCSVHHTIL